MVFRLDCVVDALSAIDIIAHSDVFETRDRILFRQGEPPKSVFFVQSGEVTLTMHAGEKEVLRLQAVKDSLLGLPAVIGNQPYSMTAQADPGAEIRVMGADSFLNLANHEAGLRHAVLRILAAEVTQARKAFARLSSEPETSFE